MSLYTDYAREYAAHAAVSVYNARYERPAMQRLLGNVRAKQVLDAACASGEYTAHLLELGAAVVGIDKSAAMLDIARERTANGAEFLQRDLAQPLDGIENDRFDLVLSSLTLHYIEEWSNPLREFNRVLRQGGRLLMSTHHPEMTLGQIEAYFAVSRVTDVWRIGGKEHISTFYHRPLQAIVNPVLDAGFRLKALVEPRLEDEGDIPPEAEHLRSRPWFLILDAIKEEVK
jgi:ubiquinone/menaquinone biosynthesis C-methylase UbiE